jgi:YD repeat-containing protein
MTQAYQDREAPGNAVTNETTYGTLTAVTATGYDSQGRAMSQTDALGNAVSTAYDRAGNVTAQWGATYPVAYEYDTRGRRIAMATTRDDTFPALPALFTVSPSTTASPSPAKRSFQKSCLKNASRFSPETHVLRTFPSLTDYDRWLCWQLERCLGSDSDWPRSRSQS